MQSVPGASFTLAYWCVLVAALLPVACAWLAKSRLLAGHGEPGFDNADPRGWLSRLTDARGRANAAQANAFEALPFFIGAVVIAHQLGAPQVPLDLLACAFITARIVYTALYVAGMPVARSVVWALGLLANIAILFIGYR